MKSTISAHADDRTAATDQEHRLDTAPAQRLVKAPPGTAWVDGYDRFTGTWERIEEAADEVDQAGVRYGVDCDDTGWLVVPVDPDEPASKADLMALAAEVHQLREELRSVHSALGETNASDAPARLDAPEDDRGRGGRRQWTVDTAREGFDELAAVEVTAENAAQVARGFLDIDFDLEHVRTASVRRLRAEARRRSFAIEEAFPGITVTPPLSRAELAEFDAEVEEACRALRRAVRSEMSS
jgi:hypothetical protein